MFGWTELDPSELENLKQVQKINFKDLEELEVCFEKCKLLLSEL